MALAWDIPVSSSFILGFAFWSGLGFWTSDIFFNFNTAVYLRGRLVRDRPTIISRYLTSWFLFDLCLVGLDLAMVAAADAVMQMRALRFARIFRAFRLLRLLKILRLQAIVQELAASTGRQWLMLVITIINTTFVLLVVAHMLTCVWVWLGRATHSAGGTSWIDIAGATALPLPMQYLHSLRYVMNAPSPPAIAPDSSHERLFDILAYWPASCSQGRWVNSFQETHGNLEWTLPRCCLRFSILIMGTTISTIAGSLHDLRSMNEARSRQRREVRLYLTGWELKSA